MESAPAGARGPRQGKGWRFWVSPGDSQGGRVRVAWLSFEKKWRFLWMRFLGIGAVRLPQMPGQELRDFVEPFRQGEFGRAVSRAGDDLQRAFDAVILECPVQCLALDQRHDVVPVAVNGDKRSAPAMHMLQRASGAGLFQIW